jgi:hypothetical protein
MLLHGRISDATLAELFPRASRSSRRRVFCGAYKEAVESFRRSMREEQSIGAAANCRCALVRLRDAQGDDWLRSAPLTVSAKERPGASEEGSVLIIDVLDLTMRTDGFEVRASFGDGNTLQVTYICSRRYLFGRGLRLSIESRIKRVPIQALLQRAVPMGHGHFAVTVRNWTEGRPVLLPENTDATPWVMVHNAKGGQGNAVPIERVDRDGLERSAGD